LHLWVWAFCYLHYIQDTGLFLCTYRPNSRSYCNPILRIIVWLYCFVNYKLTGLTFLLVFTPPKRDFVAALLNFCLLSFYFAFCILHFAFCILHFAFCSMEKHLKNSTPVTYLERLLDILPLGLRFQSQYLDNQLAKARVRLTPNKCFFCLPRLLYY
jgi:hypothetical protein